MRHDDLEILNEYEPLPQNVLKAESERTNIEARPATNNLLEHFSSMYKLKRIISWLLCF